MARLTLALVLVVIVSVLAGTANALVNIETVPVGNPGNAAEWSGTWGTSTARLCGAVPYVFRMGKYEVTAEQYTAFLNAVAKTDTYGLYNEAMPSGPGGCQIIRTGTPGSYEYSVAADWAHRPVNLVSWGDAARFANWLGNGQPVGPQGPGTTEDGSYTLNGAVTAVALTAVTRNPNANYVIPSEDEWYKAAYHKNDGVTGNYWDYPTSSDSIPGRDLNDASGNNANYAGNPYPIDSPYYTTVVGEFQNSDSPYGTFDQGGNVWEWTEAAFPDRDSRLLRGGSFRYYSPFLWADRRDGVNPPTLEVTELGFRIAEVPEPCSLLLLVLGGLAVHRRRR